MNFKKSVYITGIVVFLLVALVFVYSLNRGNSQFIGIERADKTMVGINIARSCYVGESKFLDPFGQEFIDLALLDFKVENSVVSGLSYFSKAESDSKLSLFQGHASINLERETVFETVAESFSEGSSWSEEINYMIKEDGVYEGIDPIQGYFEIVGEVHLYSDKENLNYINLGMDKVSCENYDSMLEKEKEFFPEYLK